jgi:Ni/Co efflux regulator RcnB
MKRLLTGALALSLLAGTAAVAQPYDQRHDDRGGYGQQGYDQQRNDQRGNDRSREVHQRNDERQAQHRWARGERLPYSYYQDRGHYVDYRAYHLRTPPRGYRWVRTEDNNYALVAVTTGLIASIIAANR